MIDEADRDGDGEVNQEEFLRIMKKTCLYWQNGPPVALVVLLVYVHLKVTVVLLYCAIQSTLIHIYAVIFYVHQKEIL